MRLIRTRKIRPAKLVLCMVVFIAVLWLSRSKVNTPSFQEASEEPLKRSLSSVPELVDGLGNFELPEEPPRDGPGEGGKAHHARPEQETEVQFSIARYGMNMICSDEISLDRTVPDFRHAECRHWNYPDNLPKVTVIVAFHNEGFSTLMRTVHSVLNRSPEQLIEEVILVDDFSNKEDLKSKLDSYIQKWGAKVRIIRNKEREGLINTRSRGAREAHSDIIVFLDAHCEVMKNWLPPLLAPIYNNWTTMTVPLIESINNRNFEITKVNGGNNYWRGTFEWGLQYSENIIPAREMRGRRHYTEPYRSPTHAGGLFAINRQYFLKLGLYDPGLLVWGGENFELSFKVWQCGGSLLWVPCSRVAHVYKALSTFNNGELDKKRKGNLVLGNYKRVVETWMDGKFKEYFYNRQPIAKFVDMGDISEQLKLRESLQCRSFQWYMETVAYEVLIMSPPPPPNQRWGFLKNVATQYCISPDRPPNNVPAAMIPGFCSGENEIVRLNVKGGLGLDQHCILYEKNELKLDTCWKRFNQTWEYDNTTRLMYHKGAGKCMAVDGEQLRKLSLLSCNSTDTKQKWLFIDVSHEF